MKPYQGSKTLLESKLRPPKAVRSEIVRKSVTDYASRIAEQSLCVTASAGSGKSTFLRQLFSALEERGHACVWLGIDARDNDPATLIPYLFEAMRQLARDESVASNPPVDFSRSEALRTAFQQLEIALTQLESKSVLFLDDLHEIRDPELLTHLDHFLNACDGTLSVVIGARVMPDLQIPRRVLSGQFITPSDGFLRLSPEEAEQFFENRQGLSLDRDDIAALNRFTEGWVAGLQFASIALENDPGSKGQLLSLSAGNEKQMSEYLARNVLQDQPDYLQDFLLTTAYLGRFNASFCNHVCGITNSAELLDELLEKNLFLVPLNAEGDWFRYHHLFGDFLKRTSRLRRSEQQDQIGFLAAQWCIENDLPDDAINHFLDGRHYEEAADLIARVVLKEARDKGDQANVLRWIRSLPERYRQHHPDIILAHALALGFSRAATDAKSLLDEMRASLAADACPWTLEEGEVHAYLRFAEIVEMVIYQAQEKSDTIVQEVDAWLENWSDATLVNTAIALEVKAYGHMANNRFRNAIQIASEGRQLALQAKSPYVSIWADCLIAMSHIGSGKPLPAQEFIDRARREAQGQISDNTLITLMIPLLTAQVSYEQARMDDVMVPLSTGVRFASSFGPVEPLLMAYRLQAQSQRAHGRVDEGLKTLETGLATGIANDLPRLAVSMLAELVTFHLENNDLPQAQKICDEWGLEDRSWSVRFGTTNPMQTNNLKRIEIEMALAKGHYDLANRLCRSFLIDLKSVGRPRSVVRVGILRAVALVGGGEVQRGWREMSATIRIAQADSLYSSFFELRTLCLPIINDVIASRASEGARGESPEDVIAGLLSGKSTAPPPTADPSPQPSERLAEALTPRELDMLKLAGTGCTNAEIAAELLVSVATVKWHLHNAFQKLEARNRVGALTRARELGLLPKQT